MTANFIYENVPKPIIQKQLHNLSARFPGLTHMPMLLKKIFHPQSDCKCMEKCPTQEVVDKMAYINPKPIFFGNHCNDVMGPHPLDKAGGLDGLHFEFGEPTDEQHQKKRRKQVKDFRERESVKRRVDEHLEKMHDEDTHEYAEGIHRDNADYDTYQEAIRRAKEEHRKAKEADRQEEAGFDEYGGGDL